MHRNGLAVPAGGRGPRTRLRVAAPFDGVALPTPGGAIGAASRLPCTVLDSWNCAIPPLWIAEFFPQERPTHASIPTSDATPIVVRAMPQPRRVRAASTAAS